MTFVNLLGHQTWAVVGAGNAAGDNVVLLHGGLSKQ
jgi:hypothetical protein